MDHFLPSLTTQKNKNFEKIKKIPGDIIILHMCTINHNYTVYGSLEFKRDGQIFLSFWTIFCPFTPPKNLKNQTFEKMKNRPGDIIILHKYTKNHYHMLYCSWDTMRDKCNSYFLFWAIFCPFTPLKTHKIKIKKKNGKNIRRYHHFTHVYQK